MVGERVSCRVEDTLGSSREIALEVVSNHPLPSNEPGRSTFDDLCLLQIVSHEKAFQSFSEFYLGSLDSGTPFDGQGIARTKPPKSAFVAKPFGGELRPRANFSQWYFSVEPEQLMRSHPGFSGAAVQMRNKPKVYGLLQGCLVEQVGYVIPANSIVAFLKENGIAAREFNPATPFKRAIQPTHLNISRDRLAFCDRDEQARTFDTAKRAFFENLFDREGSRLFALGIVGLEPDLPDLLQHRIGPNGVQSYKEMRRLKFKEKHESSGQQKISPFPIGLDYEQPDFSNLRQFVIEKIANASTADGAFLANMADEDVITDTLSQFDVPILFVIYCPYHLFTSEMVAAWTDCLARIAGKRHAHHPIIAVMVVTLPRGDTEPPELADDDFLLLPLLNEVDQSDVGRWLNTVRPGDNKAIIELVKDRLGDTPFRMKQLRDALFPGDDQLGASL
jgi:hypothetical protein